MSRYTCQFSGNFRSYILGWCEVDGYTRPLTFVGERQTSFGGSYLVLLVPRFELSSAISWEWIHRNEKSV